MYAVVGGTLRRHCSGHIEFTILRLSAYATIFHNNTDKDIEISTELKHER